LSKLGLGGCPSFFFNGKDLRQLTQRVGNPLASVLVALAGVIILAAKKGAPDAAADHVIVRRIGEADLA